MEHMLAASRFIVLADGNPFAPLISMAYSHRDSFSGAIYLSQQWVRDCINIRIMGVWYDQYMARVPGIPGRGYESGNRLIFIYDVFCVIQVTLVPGQKQAKRTVFGCIVMIIHAYSIKVMVQ